MAIYLKWPLYKTNQIERVQKLRKNSNYVAKADISLDGAVP